MFNHIKDFFANIFKSRLVVLIALFSILFFVLVQKLFVLQIVKGEDYLENYTLSIRKTKVIQGTRGNIYDRDGELLATNRLAYSVQIEDNGSYENKTEKNKLVNETINTVIDMVEKNGDSLERLAKNGVSFNCKNNPIKSVDKKGASWQRIKN